MTDIDSEGMSLLAALVERNVADAAHTSNMLISNVEQQRDMWAKHFADLWDALAKIPDMTRTVYIDKLIARYEWTRENADRHIAHEADE